MRLTGELRRDDRPLSRLREAGRDLRADQHAVHATARSRTSCSDAEPRAVPRRKPPRCRRGCRGDAASRPIALDGDAPAGIIYTSGTTGASKGAVLTHNNFAANAVNLLTCWQITAADRFLLALPLFHVHGLGNGLHCWLSGLPDAAAGALRTSEGRGRVPRFPADAVLRRADDLRAAAGSAAEDTAREIGAFMRLFVSGSAPLPAQVFEEFRARFGHTILERYGMSENLMNISNPYVGERRPGTRGAAAARRVGAGWWMARST